jgi:hypothetical protein
MHNFSAAMSTTEEWHRFRLAKVVALKNEPAADRR